MYRFIGPPLTDSFRDFYGFSEEKALEAVRFYREYYRDKGIFENRVYEGMEETLKELKNRGKRLIVATSKPEPLPGGSLTILGWLPILNMWPVWNWTVEGERRQK